MLSVASLTSLSSLLSPPLSLSLSRSWSPDPDGLWPEGTSWPDARVPGFLSCGTHKRMPHSEGSDVSGAKDLLNLWGACEYDLTVGDSEILSHLICHVGQVSLHGIGVLPICIVLGLYLTNSVKHHKTLINLNVLHTVAMKPLCPVILFC